MLITVSLQSLLGFVVVSFCITAIIVSGNELLCYMSSAVCLHFTFFTGAGNSMTGNNTHTNGHGGHDSTPEMLGRTGSSEKEIAEKDLSNKVQ